MFIGPSIVSKALLNPSLAVIARILGDETATQVATSAEYEWHRDPEWDPFAAVYNLV